MRMSEIEKESGDSEGDENAGKDPGEDVVVGAEVV